jgi:hypothetical protein
MTALSAWLRLGTAEGMAMDLKVVDGWYIVELPKAVLVLTKAQFVEGLRRGKWWRRHQAMAQRQAALDDDADLRGLSPR